MHSSGKEPQDQRKAAIVDASTAGNLLPGSDPGSVSSTLLERLKARRPEAWQRLVDLYGPVVYRWCRWSGVGAGDVPDVVQEVFTAIATHICGFPPPAAGRQFYGLDADHHAEQGLRSFPPAAGASAGPGRQRCPSGAAEGSGAARRRP